MSPIQALALYAVLGMACGYLCARLIGAGRDFSAAMTLVGLAAGVGLYAFATNLGS